jgi:hypothetical protein
MVFDIHPQDFTRRGIGGRTSPADGRRRRQAAMGAKQGLVGFGCRALETSRARLCTWSLAGGGRGQRLNLQARRSIYALDAGGAEPEADNDLPSPSNWSLGQVSTLFPFPKKRYTQVQFPQNWELTRSQNCGNHRNRHK